MGDSTLILREPFCFDPIHNVRVDSVYNGPMILDLKGSDEFLTTVQAVDGGKTWE
jgi:hypothetical protein